MLKAAEIGATSAVTANGKPITTTINNNNFDMEKIMQGFNTIAENIANYNMVANQLSAASAREAMENSNAQAQKQMEFQAAQALAQQQFNSAEAQKNRDYQTAERLAAQQFNSAEALKNRQWQENMSNTSYQRAVQDMIKAGINPILAAQNGGASAGTGSAASINGMPGATASGSSAMQGAMGQSFTYQAQTSQIAEKIQLAGMVMGALGKLVTSMTSAKGNAKAVDALEAISNSIAAETGNDRYKLLRGQEAINYAKESRKRILGY